MLILKELHDKLDALVFEAYGWPADLGDEQILERLVALNNERAAAGEGRRYRVAPPRLPDPPLRLRRRARPPRRGEAPGAPSRARHPGRPRPRRRPAGDEAPFPTGNELEETAAVMRALASAATPLSVADIARTFHRAGQGRREARGAHRLRPRPPRPSRLDR